MTAGFAKGLNGTYGLLYSAAGTPVAIPSAFITLPKAWEIHAIAFFYRATATAGNRLPALSITFPGTLYPHYEWTTPYNVPAGAKFSCSGGVGGPTFIPPDQASITLSPADPVASALSLALSTRYVHRIQSVRFTYVSTATAGNRLPSVQFLDPSGNVIHESFVATQAASLTVSYTFALGSVAAAPAGSSHVLMSLPMLDLQAGSTIKLRDALAIDAADRVAGIQIADLTAPSVLSSEAVGFAPLPLPTPLKLDVGGIIAIYDANNIDNGVGGDTVELYVAGRPLAGVGE